MDNIIILKLLLIILLIILIILLFRCLRRKKDKGTEHELASLPIDKFNAYFTND